MLKVRSIDILVDVMNKQEDIESQLPTDEDENVGAVEPKKKQKKRKSKEERIKNRKVVAIFFVIMLIISLVFYMLPKFKGETKNGFGNKNENRNLDQEKDSGFKGYTEIDF